MQIWPDEVIKFLRRSSKLFGSILRSSNAIRVNKINKNRQTTASQIAINMKLVLLFRPIHPIY